jgi:hypothetical protein
MAEQGSYSNQNKFLGRMDNDKQISRDFGAKQKNRSGLLQYYGE